MADAAAPAQDDGSISGRLVRNVIFLGIGQAVSTGLGFLLAAALGRTLAPAEFGIIYLVGTIYGFVGVLIDWGQSTYVVRDAARGRADEAEFVGAALAIRVAGTLAAALGGALIAGLIGYDGLTMLLVALSALAGFPGSLAALFGFVFRGRDRMDLDVLIGLVAKAIGVVAVIVTLVLSKSLIAVVTVPVIGGIGALVLSLALLRRLEIHVRPPSGALVGELFRTGTPIAVLSLCLGMQSFVDVALLSLLTGPAVVGWLGGARTILGIFMAPANILASASFPEMSRAAGSVDDLRRLLTASARVILAIGTFAAIVLLLFAELAVRATYGSGKLDQAATLLQATSLFLPLFFLNFVIGNAVFAVGRSTAFAIAKVLCMALGAILGWLAINYTQAHFQNGAIGVILAYGVMEGLMLYLLASLLPKGAVDRQVPMHLARSYAIFGFAAAAFAILPLPLWASAPILAAVVGAGSLATGLVLVSDITRVGEVMTTWVHAAQRVGNAIAGQWRLSRGRP
ncbi:MAG: oligosaccharide flippase family protein [Hyphomicrobiaceae bacterium]|nr:oligosaccharide flippase family protein [Hyphomicrobiaceae bacterium]